MPGKRAADVTISCYWDPRWKRWTMTIRGSNYSAFRRVETTSALTNVEGNLLLDAIRREMESWLA